MDAMEQDVLQQVQHRENLNCCPGRSEEKAGSQPGCLGQVVLLGNPDTKRTNYLMQAAVKADLSLLFMDWKHWEEWKGQLPENKLFIKIDPPLWDSCFLEKLDDLMGGYVRQLEELCRMEESHRVEFLNHPLAIAELLDKRACKARLLKAGLPVTETLEEDAEISFAGPWERNAKRHRELLKAELPVTETLEEGAEISFAGSWRSAKRHRELLKAELPVTETLEEGAEISFAGPWRSAKQHREKQHQAEQRREEQHQEKLSAEGLLGLMRRSGTYQVFIKPVSGSGAAGVSAFRWQPATGRMALYTCALMHSEAGLVNTKRLRHFSKPGEIIPLLDRILMLDCIVERWYAKAEYQGFSYDLRAVVQDGSLDFLLSRLSKGPITNLHLNNHPLEMSALGLPESVTASITDVCRRAMSCFPGLRSAGIDILLEKGSLKPRIIEMNAQGDLIYQDIFHENLIYRHQAEIMKRWQGI